MIYMRNITITTAKSATYLENVGENPCLLTVVGPEGAPVDYAIPGWSCVIAGIIVAAAAIGDSALGFLDRVVDGFRKTGRELKRFGKKVGKLIKKVF